MTREQDPNTIKPGLPVVVIGAGGHAGVLLSLLRTQRRNVLALHDDNSSLHGKPYGNTDLQIVGGLDAIKQYQITDVELVNAIGSAHRPTARQAVYEKLSEQGYAFATLVHPSATVDSGAIIAPAAQIMASATIQFGVTICANALINTGAIIDHDTTIGEHTHVSPGVTICGGVTVGTGCHIGAGATVIQGITIGHGAVIGAGATVINDVTDGQVVAGTPARPIPNH